MTHRSCVAPTFLSTRNTNRGKFTRDTRMESVLALGIDGAELVDDRIGRGLAAADEVDLGLGRVFSEFACERSTDAASTGAKDDLQPKPISMSPNNRIEQEAAYSDGAGQMELLVGIASSFKVVHR